MGIPRKRQFDANQHGTSSGFQELSMPSNLEAVKLELDMQAQQQMSDEMKARVAMMS